MRYPFSNPSNNSEQSSNVSLCIGVCRSGTTALAQVYSKSGLESFYQPVKGDLRRRVRKQPAVNFKILARYAAQGPIFTKETLGPFFPFESNIDYLTQYAHIGFNIRDIHLIFAFREPIATYLSWLANWGHLKPRKVLFSNYLSAQRKFSETENQARAECKKITYHCLEAFRSDANSDSTQCWQSMFSKSKPYKKFEKEWLLNWGIQNFHDSKVRFPLEPKYFSIRDIHETIPHYGLPARGEKLRSKFLPSADEFHQIEDHGLIEKYKVLANLCDSLPVRVVSISQ